MIRGGFLSAEDRRHLIALARDGSAASRLTRRANALVLLELSRSRGSVFVERRDHDPLLPLPGSIVLIVRVLEAP
jgi:hypothetical protein